MKSSRGRGTLPQLNVNDNLDIINIVSRERSLTPSKYAEASLVKKLGLGIGRPATYATQYQQPK